MSWRRWQHGATLIEAPCGQGAHEATAAVAAPPMPTTDGVDPAPVSRCAVMLRYMHLMVFLGMPCLFDCLDSAPWCCCLVPEPCDQAPPLSAAEFALYNLFSVEHS